MPEDCDGCHSGDETRRRGHWHMCDECRTQFMQRLKEARANLLLKTYTPEAHLWRISGTAGGDISKDDMGMSADFTFKRPVLVEDVCQWCAIRKALLTLDPWAFDLMFNEHGDHTEHDPTEVRDDSWWCWHDGPIGIIIEDLGVIGKDRWGRRLGHPTLPLRTAAAAAARERKE